MAGPLRVSAGFGSGAERPGSRAGLSGAGHVPGPQVPLGAGSCTTRRVRGAATSS